MARRIPYSERPALIRDPASWARDWGWLSPRKAASRAATIREIADSMEFCLDDANMGGWVKELRYIANEIDPARAIAATKKRASRVEKS